ncbi:angiopoietin-2b isoform X4 [Echeneis naucrates]|uniref:angiopoietin-2b isoform X4 n=1 Tax=Echeneis naucrates TaxID=173247 RepID=UPI001113E594|nr:angiopoietin-2-like isoform X4 [Echeneis naucrates]
MGRLLALTLAYLAYLLAATIGSERQQHHVQHGPCSYTFILPEVEHCHPLRDFRVTNTLQRDSPSEAEPSLHERKLENLESAMENNTQWLQKVLNQTSRLEIQLLEYSLFTNRLEKHILLQTQEISRLSDKNSFLEQRLLALEARYGRELQGLQSEKQQLQEILERQSRLVSKLQGELGSSTFNSTLLQRQQAMLTHTVQQLLAMVNHCNEMSNMPKEESLTFRDCAEILRSGMTESGIYSIQLPNSTQTIKVFCDMKTRGGGWTVLQHRTNGSVNFHRGWRDYKMGFGEPSGEHWLGNDIIHKLTSSQEYSLQVQLKDREGNEAFSHYDRFYIDGEDSNYSLHAEGFSGTAGRTSSLTHNGTQFSTKDRDNDLCTCKCSQLASGGWWFEACGPSNLNGIYYPASTSVVRYNGIKWYYWKGPNLMATMTTMMVRPANF